MPLKKYFFETLFKRLLLLLFVLFGSAIVVSAQHKVVGYLEFDGKCLKNNKPLSGAVVTLYKNTEKQTQLTTGKNGKFKFFLDFGANYKITFSAEGAVNMSLLVMATIPTDKENIFPIYEIEVPFFEAGNADVNVSKYKNPFTKVIFDGKNTFMDDEDYLKQFANGLLIDHDAEAKALAEKRAKEKAEQDKLAAQKAADDKSKSDAAKQLAAQQRAQKDAAELAKLKSSEETDLKTKESDKNPSESMETDAIKLEKEKEAKAELAKKNAGIRSKYENDLLKAVAENERIEKEKKYEKMKAVAESNSVIETLRREAELKSKSNGLHKQEEKKQKETIINEQVQEQEIKGLIQAAAFAKRSIKINEQKKVPDIHSYQMEEAPSVAVMEVPGFLKNVKTITVTLGKKIISYRRESYVWGSEYYYKDNVEINVTRYIQETSKYTSAW
ncbi:MAG: SpaA isopeptide-forming pilin-related protein [Bacteroidia bacterium]